MNNPSNDSESRVAGPPPLKQAGGAGLPVAAALIAFVAVVATLDTAGVFPTLPGPGITSDEPFDAAFGKRYVVAWQKLGFRLFTTEHIEQVFGSSSEDHPPLGRWMLGWAGRLTDVRPNDSTRLLIVPYRLAPALAFAMLVLLVGHTASRWYGQIAGGVAGVSLLLMPRLFAHAHLAALDTFVALTYAAAVLAVWWAFNDGKSWKVALAGVAWGAALLVKMQGFLIAVPVALWAIGEWASGRVGEWKSGIPLFPGRQLVCRSTPNPLTPVVGRLALWAAVGMVVFFAGWPWLWINTLDHLREYLGRSTNRAVIEVWYFGQAVADRELPWHYPWVMFAVTVPVGLQALGLLGVFSTIRERRWGPRETLLACAGAFPLLLFSLPGVVVYDGVRLFLMAFPFWAIAVGRGGQVLFEWLARRLSKRAARIVLTVGLMCQGVGIVWFHPYQLSYYNLLVGGLRGAERLGLEVTYWGDTVDGKLFDALDQDAKPGSCALFAPSLYRGHADSVQNDFLALRPDAPRLEGDLSANCKYFVVYNRKPYLREPHLPAELVEVIENAEPVYENGCQGVWLARVYRLR